MAGVRVSELRGAACFLVVLFHAIGSEPAEHTRMLADGIRILGYVRMPLFMALTGFLYGLTRATRPMTFPILRRRAMRILPPFVLVSLACCLIDWVRSGDPPLLKAVIYAPWHMWYLQALLVILTIVLMIERVIQPKPRTFWYLAIIAALLSQSGLMQRVPEFSIAGAFALLPHFLFGAALGIRRDDGLPAVHRAAIYTLGIAALVFIEAGTNGPAGQWSPSSLPGIAIGWAAFVALATYMVPSRLLARIGEGSFPIFLWHLPCSALLSAVLLNPMSVAPYTGIALRVTFGMAVPLLMIRILERFAPKLIPLVGSRQQPRTRRIEPQPRTGLQLAPALPLS